MYGTWRNLCGLQRERPWEPAFAHRQGRRRHEATYSMELQMFVDAGVVGVVGVWYVCGVCGGCGGCGGCGTDD